MSIARYTVVRCDGGCGAEASTPFPATAAQVRAWNETWRHNRHTGRDLCPDCQVRPASGPRLSRGQAVVLEASADGAPLPEVGRRLGISRQQAGARLSEVYRALDVAWLPRGEKRTAALDVARKHGLIDESKENAA